MDATLSELVEVLFVSPVGFVLLGDFVRLLIVDFFMAVTWFSKELVELRKKVATRCGIFSCTASSDGPGMYRYGTVRYGTVGYCTVLRVRMSLTRRSGVFLLSGGRSVQ